MSVSDKVTGVTTPCEIMQNCENTTKKRGMCGRMMINDMKDWYKNLQVQENAKKFKINFNLFHICRNL